MGFKELKKSKNRKTLFRPLFKAGAERWRILGSK
jgi:hypothetical protein